MSTKQRTAAYLLAYPDAGQLAMALRQAGLAQVLAGLSAPTVDSSNRTVTADICLMVDSAGVAESGIVLAVHGTVGGSPGPMAIILTGVPNAGEVLVEYVSGQPKLTFAAADAITGCRVHWIDTGNDGGVNLAARLATELGAG